MLPGFNPLNLAGQLAGAIGGQPDSQAQPPAANQEPILRYFTYQHLPEHLQQVSAPFCQLAHALVENCPRNAERSVALRKLLEAKDAAVRAVLP